MSKSELHDKDSGFKALFGSGVAALSGQLHVKVGVLADSDRGGMHEKDKNGKALPLTVAEIAVVNEYGTRDGRIPSRPAFRQTFDKQREELARTAGELAAKVLLEKWPVDKALNLLGLKLASEIKRTITNGEGVPPPNAQSTIDRKGSSHTLVNTGRLVGAISWAIVKDGVQSAAKYVGGRR